MQLSDILLSDVLRKFTVARLREASIRFLPRPNIEKNVCNPARGVQIEDVLGLEPNGLTLPGSVYDIHFCDFKF